MPNGSSNIGIVKSKIKYRFRLENHLERPLPDIDNIAAAIHATWRALSRSEGWSMQPRLDQPFAALTEPDKEDNRAAARRMGDVLKAGGFALDLDTSAIPPSALESNIETMAEAEHNGWMAHRAANGWTHSAARDDAAKQHPSMVPYAQLPELEKEKDRNNLRHYPEFAIRAGLKIIATKP